MNAIQEIKDEAIRKVALTLRSSGLASSETEAVRMAMMMSKTSQKVTQNFDQKRTGFNHSSGFPAQPSVPHSAPETARSEPHVRVINVQAPPSVQEKPRMTEEKEDFIFGDIQEKETVQKVDVYKVDDEFEEVVVQEVILTKDVPLSQLVQENSVQAPKVAPVQTSRPSMFGSGTIQSQKPVEQAHVVHVVVDQPKHDVPAQNAFANSSASQPVHHELKPQLHSEQMPHVSASPSQTPISAAGSAQMAFASLLGDVQRTQAHHQEQKPAVRPSSAQASHPAHVEVAQVHQPQPQVAPHVAPANPTPRPVVNHAPDPRANMMKEANVDLSKMFNVNK